MNNFFFFFCENCFLRMSFGQIMEVENMRKSFWRLKEGEKGKNFDKKVNSLIGTKFVVVLPSQLNSNLIFFV